MKDFWFFDLKNYHGQPRDYVNSSLRHFIKSNISKYFSTMTQKIVINIVLMKLVCVTRWNNFVSRATALIQLSSEVLRMWWSELMPCHQLIEDLNKSQIYYQRDDILLKDNFFFIFIHLDSDRRVWLRIIWTEKWIPPERIVALFSSSAPFFVTLGFSDGGLHSF